MVIVYLAGDVIPQIAKVVSHDSDTPYEAPQYCTSCGAKLLHYEKTTVCPNHRECPEQIKGRLKLFVSRDAFNITGLGDKTIDALVDKGILSEPADVFGLTEIDVNDNVVSLFTEKKNVTLERFIYSLGIPSVGKRTSEILAKHFESIESFIYNTFDRKLDDVKLRELVGDNVVDNCLSFFKDEYFKQMALDLACKVNIIETPNISGLLSGVSFVFTGALEFVTRQNAKRIAEKAGARVMTDVSSKTDYVVVGANPGSKATKALNLGIRTITEREFLNMCMMEK
jgi:DNA ligase (NAD+)